MRKRLVRALIFIALAIGGAVGVASGAGALGFDDDDGPGVTRYGTAWD